MDNNHASPNHTNGNLNIYVNDMVIAVNKNILLKESNLFKREYTQQVNLRPEDSKPVDSQKVKSEQISITRKYGGPLLRKYLDICQGRNCALYNSNFYDLFLISEEWESPNITNRLQSAFESKIGHDIKLDDVLSKLRQNIDDSLGVSNTHLDILAKHFKDIYSNTAFENLPPQYICRIIQNPHCEFPSRQRLDQFINIVLEKYGRGCASLAQLIDPLKTDIEVLRNLKRNLTKAKLLPMYPNINRILQLRECELDYKNLQNKNKELQENNEYLQRKVEILLQITKGEDEKDQNGELENQDD